MTSSKQETGKIIEISKQNAGNIEEKPERKKIFMYRGRVYVIDFSKKVDSIGDFYEAGKIIYVDKNVPEKFHQGIAAHEIEERKLIKKGHSYGFSHNIAQEKGIEFYEKTFGVGMGRKMIKEEEKIVLKLFFKYSLEDAKKMKEADYISYNQAYTEELPIAIIRLKNKKGKSIGKN